MENTFNNISTTELLAILSALPTIVISLIVIHRKFMHRIRNTFAFDAQFFMVGLAMGMVAAIALFNWTTYEKYGNYETTVLDDTPEIVEQIPRTVHTEKKKLPPPPKKQIKPIELKKIIMVDDLPKAAITKDFVDETPDVDEPVLVQTSVVNDPAPIVAPVMEKEDEAFIVIAEQMPRFPGCEHLDIDKKEKEACSKEALLSYVFSSLEYPALARENRIEGLVVVQFIVTKNGDVTEVEIVRDIGAGCGKETARVVKKMNDLPEGWIPGRQRGRKVNVKYTLPVKFRLD